MTTTALSATSQVLLNAWKVSREEDLVSKYLGDFHKSWHYAEQIHPIFHDYKNRCLYNLPETHVRECSYDISYVPSYYQPAQCSLRHTSAMFKTYILQHKNITLLTFPHSFTAPLCETCQFQRKYLDFDISWEYSYEYAFTEEVLQAVNNLAYIFCTDNRCLRKAQNLKIYLKMCHLRNLSH